MKTFRKLLSALLCLALTLALAAPYPAHAHTKETGSEKMVAWGLMPPMLYGGHAYRLFAARSATYEEMQAFCASKGGYLACIGDEAEERALLDDYVLPSDVFDVVIGLYADDAGEWHWVNGDPVEYVDWIEGEPNGFDSGERYATFAPWLDEDGRWNDSEVDPDDYFLCEWDSPDMPKRLSPASGEKTFEGHTYRLYFSEDWTWEEMREYSESEGGHLAVIDSPEEELFLRQLALSHHAAFAYFGLYQDDEGDWRWVDGTAATDLPWAEGEPNNGWNGTERYGCYNEPRENAEWNDGNGEGGWYLLEWDYDVFNVMPQPEDDPESEPEGEPVVEAEDDEEIVSDDGEHEAYYEPVAWEDLRLSEGDVLYARNQLFLVASEDAGKGDIEALAASIGGRVAGYIELGGCYQLKLEGDYDFEGLRALARRLEAESPLVELAEPNEIIPVDPASEDDGGRAAWTDEWEDHSAGAKSFDYQLGELDPVVPAGNNWWAEAVNLPYAWRFAEENRVEEIKVGVLDMDFDTGHRDLSFAEDSVVLNRTPAQDAHGTHVAGLIAARNDETDIRGASPNAKLYVASRIKSLGPADPTHPLLDDMGKQRLDWASQITDENYSFILAIMYRVAVLLDRGVKVINMSFCLDFCNAYYDKVELGLDRDGSLSLYFLDFATRAWERFIGRCEKSYPQFLIVKATGNFNGALYLRTGKTDPSKGAMIRARTEAEIAAKAGEGSDAANGYTISGITEAYDFLGGIDYNSAARKHIITVGACGLDCSASLRYDGDAGTVDSLGYSVASFSVLNADVVAPGDNLNAKLDDDGDRREYSYQILSTVPAGLGSPAAADDTTGMMIGTSMATPIVAGIVALTWGWQPELSYERVRQCLLGQEHATNYLMDYVDSPMADALAAMKRADELAKQDGCYHDHDRDIGECGYFTGFVYTGEGKGKDDLAYGCRIELYQNDQLVYDYVQAVSEDGFAMLVKPGEYDVKVSCPSCGAPARERIEVKADRITSKDFLLNEEDVVHSGDVMEIKGVYFLTDDVGLGDRGFGAFPALLDEGQRLRSLAYYRGMVYCGVLTVKDVDYSYAIYRANPDGSGLKKLKTSVDSGGLMNFSIVDNLLYYAVTTYEGEETLRDWHAVSLDDLKEVSGDVDPPEAVRRSLQEFMGWVAWNGAEYFAAITDTHQISLKTIDSDGVPATLMAFDGVVDMVIVGVTAVRGEPEHCWIYFTATEETGEYEYQTVFFRYRVDTGAAELLMYGDEGYSPFFGTDDDFYDSFGHDYYLDQRG